MRWPPERKKFIQKLLGEGKSCSQIAEHLNRQSRQPGEALFTRNSVIGIIHRCPDLNVPSLPSPPQAPKRALPKAKPQPPEQPPRAPPPSKPPAVIAPAPLAVEKVEEIGACTLITLSAHVCRWPIGDPQRDGFSFCGRPADAPGPYCPHHTQVAFVPSKPRPLRASAFNRHDGMVRSRRRAGDEDYPQEL
jgi:GcrA cell cycle regulator